MEKFNRVLRGYDTNEVNQFLDKIIGQVEKMVADIKIKDAKIKELSGLELENSKLKEKLEQYNNMEATLNKAILMAEKTSEQIKLNAHQEGEIVLEDAKRNASRIVNEALLRAERTQRETDILRRNTNIFKRRLKDVVETQLEVIEDIEKIEL